MALDVTITPVDAKFTVEETTKLSIVCQGDEAIGPFEVAIYGMDAELNGKLVQQGNSLAVVKPMTMQSGNVLASSTALSVCPKKPGDGKLEVKYKNVILAEYEFKVGSSANCQPPDNPPDDKSTLKILLPEEDFEQNKPFFASIVLEGPGVSGDFSLQIIGMEASINEEDVKDGGFVDIEGFEDRGKSVPTVIGHMEVIPLGSGFLTLIVNCTVPGLVEESVEETFKIQAAKPAAAHPPPPPPKMPVRQLNATITPPDPAQTPPPAGEPPTEEMSHHNGELDPKDTKPESPEPADLESTDVKAEEMGVQNVPAKKSSGKAVVWGLLAIAFVFATLALLVVGIGYIQITSSVEDPSPVSDADGTQDGTAGEPEASEPEPAASPEPPAPPETPEPPAAEPEEPPTATEPEPPAAEQPPPAPEPEPEPEPPAVEHVPAPPPLRSAPPPCENMRRANPPKMKRGEETLYVFDCADGSQRVCKTAESRDGMLVVDGCSALH